LVMRWSDPKFSEMSPSAGKIRTQKRKNCVAAIVRRRKL
jgi:hypothetical protein